MPQTNSITMMALGDFRFALSTAAFQELERESNWRWASVDRIGVRPAKQYVGPGEDTIRMSGSVFPHFRGGLSQISGMREQAALGAPLLMIDGTGRIWGDYCIQSVSETQTVFFANGTPRRIDFNLSLTMYGG